MRSGVGEIEAVRVVEGVTDVVRNVEVDRLDAVCPIVKLSWSLELLGVVGSTCSSGRSCVSFESAWVLEVVGRVHVGRTL